MTTKVKVVLSVIAIVLVILLGFYVYSHTQFGQRKISHFESNIIGLSRDITVYSFDGKPIRTYHTRSQIEKTGDGTLSFFTEKRKRVDVNGGIVISEEQ
jgi:hypothetical protein